MTVIAIKGRVIAVAGVCRVPINALASVSTRYGSVQTRSSAVPTYSDPLINLPLQIHRHPVHPQAP